MMDNSLLCESTYEVRENTAPAPHSSNSLRASLIDTSPWARLFSSCELIFESVSKYVMILSDSDNGFSSSWSNPFDGLWILDFTHYNLFTCYKVRVPLKLYLIAEKRLSYNVNWSNDPSNSEEGLKKTNVQEFSTVFKYEFTEMKNNYTVFTLISFRLWWKIYETTKFLEVTLPVSIAFYLHKKSPSLYSITGSETYSWVRFWTGFNLTFSASAWTMIWSALSITSPNVSFSRMVPLGIFRSLNSSNQWSGDNASPRTYFSSGTIF